jgi:hypothetical protein
MWQIALGTVMISFAAVFVKLVSVPPTAIAFYRMLFGGLILTGIMVCRRPLKTPQRSFQAVSIRLHARDTLQRPSKSIQLCISAPIGTDAFPVAFARLDLDFGQMGITLLAPSHPRGTDCGGVLDR